MNSILNSISSGDLQVLNVPRVKPEETQVIIEELHNHCNRNDKLSNINTGFGGNNDLYYECSCNLPKLKVPLYKENFFKEFQTESEKSAARHSLGIYNKGDVVAMSLLTAENNIPAPSEWLKAEIKQMRKGDNFFIPLTSFSATYDSEGHTLDSRMREIDDLFKNHQKKLDKINEISQDKQIESLGDVKLFLEGFDKKESLRETIDAIDQQMVRFEITGQL